MARIRYLFFIGLCVMLILGGQTACKKGEEVGDITEEEAAMVQEDVIEFEGTVKMALGKYLYVPQVPGFDIVVQGPLDVGEAQALIGHEIRGKGQASPEYSSILVADEIEIKEAEDVWRMIFKRSEEFALDDYVALETRDDFEVLSGLSYDKKVGWEGKDKAKVYGRLMTEAEGEGGEVNYRIVVLDDQGKEIGKILVDELTDFAEFYVKKLRLFDRFWFYVTIKETVDWRSRRRTRDLFHADVFLAGLY